MLANALIFGGTMNRGNANATYGAFRHRARKTARLNLAAPRRGGIRL